MIKIEKHNLITVFMYKQPLDAGERELAKQLRTVGTCIDSLGNPISNTVLLGAFQSATPEMGTGVPETLPGGSLDEQQHVSEFFCSKYAVSQQRSKQRKCLNVHKL